MTRLLALAAALLLAHALPALAVGKFAYVEGAVTVRDSAGASRAAAAGMQFQEGETVVTVDGRAHLRFDDGAWVALARHTVFEVRGYPRIEEDRPIVMSMLKGSARTITGAIARLKKERFLFVTPTATIGVRGTSFQVTLCLQSCDVPDGLYVTGGDGTVYVRNGFGEIDLTRGKTAYVANAGTPPRESNVKPLQSAPEPVQLKAGNVLAGGGEFTPGNYVFNSGASEALTVLTVTSGGAAAAASGTFSASVAGLSGSVTGIGFGAATGFLNTPGAQLTLVVDGSGRLFGGAAIDPAGGASAAAFVPQVTNAGTDGVLYWGRWTNTTAFVSVSANGQNVTGQGSLNGASSAHYIFATPSASIPVAGIATYSFVGGTQSTSQAGVVGSGVTGGTLSVNFGANTVSTNLSIMHNGAWTANGSGVLSGGNPARSQFNSTAGSATGPGGTYNFDFAGFLAGGNAPTAPSRAGMSWQISAPDPFVGTAGFRCSGGC